MSDKLKLSLALCLPLAACSGYGPTVTGYPSPAGITPMAVDLKETSLRNKTAHIPPQCYSQTQDAKDGSLHNPCYSCHTESPRPNFANDAELQLAYALPEPARANPWQNLFQDRRTQISTIADDAMLAYIRRSNYLAADGSIALAEKLRQPPAAWDYDGNGRWDGYVPDAYFNFDADGFDRDPQGGYTGWRSFAYLPFPGGFWPTNGNIGDVLIRLPAAFRQNERGEFDLTVYKTNLAVVEALMKERDVAIPAVDEQKMGGIDLDKDGRIGTAERIRYDWAPLQQRFMHYVGQAGLAQQNGQVHAAASLLPEGSEFLHTLRYIEVDSSGENRLAPRMKEVRYARKRRWLNYAELERDAAAEAKEDYDFPDRLPVVRGNSEIGVGNSQGWVYAGFIEDAEGALRPQSFEELAYCSGCHGRLGASRDGIFAFPRKPDDSAGRNHWQHWTQLGLRGLAERIRSDGQAEYGYYLQHNLAGDDFRANPEILAAFFDADGQPKPDKLAKLRQDVSLLLFSSPERAMQLNKAYWLIVREQSFVLGRDAVAAPLENVHRKLKPNQGTGINRILKGY